VSILDYAFGITPVMKAFCYDCYKRGKLRNMVGEWTVLKKHIWEKVWPGTAMKSAHERMPMEHFLCIGCIEDRLGRRLTRADFDMRRKHNKFQPTMSPRFRNRVSR
jgi:hypothetical protein